MPTYTLTPTFDTELIALPSDVQVWYSNDGTNYAYLPAWADSRNGNSITLTSEGSDISITAALYYTGGTRVQDDTATNIPTQGIILNPSATAAITFNAQGWDANLVVDGSITNGTDPVFDFTKTSITVARPGYDATGAAVTRNLTLKLTDVVQQAYPNSASKDTVNGSGDFNSRVSLDRWVYPTDTITGTIQSGFDEGIIADVSLSVTNNVTTAVPDVICNWASPIVDFEHTNTLTVDLAAAHMSASSGDMGIACVKLHLYKGGVFSSTQTVTSTTTRTSATTGLSYAVFTASWDITADADGTAYEVRADVYPVWGTVKSTNSQTFGDREYADRPELFAPLFRWKDTQSGGIPTMYVTDTGSDANPGTSGSPKATIQNAIATLAGLSASTDAEGIIRVTGTFTNFDLNHTGTGSSWTYPLKIMANTGVKPTFTGGCTSTNGRNLRRIPFVICENLNWDFTSAVNAITGTAPNGGLATLWGDSNLNNTPIRVIYKSCDWDSGTNNATDYTFVYQTFDIFEMAPVGALTAVFYSSDNYTGIYRRPGIFVGFDYSITDGSSQPKCCLASKFHSGLVAQTLYDDSVWANPVTVTTPLLGRTNQNYFHGWNRAYSSSSGANAGTLHYSNDVALIGNFYEQPLGSAAAAACLGVFNDGVTEPCNNILLWHNTTIGQRTNLFYNDTTNPLRLNMAVKGNAFAAAFIKSDQFAPDAANVNNWAGMYQTEWKHNVAPAFTNASGLTAATFPFYRYDATWYGDDDNTPAVFSSYPANGTRSAGAAPIGLAAAWATTTGWSMSAADFMIPVLQDNTAPTSPGCVAVI